MVRYKKRIVIVLFFYVAGAGDVADGKLAMSPVISNVKD